MFTKLSPSCRGFRPCSCSEQVTAHVAHGVDGQYLSVRYEVRHAYSAEGLIARYRLIVGALGWTSADGTCRWAGRTDVTPCRGKFCAASLACALAAPAVCSSPARRLALWTEHVRRASVSSSRPAR